MEQQYLQFIEEKRAEIKEKYGDALELLYEDWGNGAFRLMVKLKGTINNAHSWLWMGRMSKEMFDMLKLRFDDKVAEVAEARWK